MLFVRSLFPVFGDGARKAEPLPSHGFTWYNNSRLKFDPFVTVRYEFAVAGDL